MIGAEHGVAECRGSKKRKARDQHPARRIPCRGERDQRAERDRQVIGVALLEAERTGADIQHQLKEPRARQRRRRNDRDCQRRGQRGVAGVGRMRGAGGGVNCHVGLPWLKASYPGGPTLSRWPRSNSSVLAIPHLGPTRNTRVDRQGAPAIFRRLRDAGLVADVRKPLWRNW